MIEKKKVSNVKSTGKYLTKVNNNQCVIRWFERWLWKHQQLQESEQEYYYYDYYYCS